MFFRGQSKDLNFRDTRNMFQLLDSYVEMLLFLHKGIVPLKHLVIFDDFGGIEFAYIPCIASRRFRNVRLRNI